MKKQNELIRERLQHTLITGRLTEPDIFMTALKSDLITLLSDYMSLERESLSAELCAAENGEYELTVKARTSRLIDPGKMAQWD